MNKWEQFSPLINAEEILVWYFWPSGELLCEFYFSRLAGFWWSICLEVLEKKINIQFSFYVFATKFQCTSHQFKLNSLGNFLITLFGGSRKLQIHKNYVFFLFLQILSMLLYQTWIVALQGLPNKWKMRPVCLWGTMIYFDKITIVEFHSAHFPFIDYCARWIIGRGLYSFNPLL